MSLVHQPQEAGEEEDEEEVEEEGGEESHPGPRPPPLDERLDDRVAQYLTKDGIEESGQFWECLHKSCFVKLVVRQFRPGSLSRFPVL